MNKILAPLALLIALSLTGCNNSSTTTPVSDPKPPLRTSPIFAPGDGELPIPNDLLFGGTLDLTLNAPTADPLDESDPVVAINSLDGWSAIAPFAIAFRNRGEDGTNLDASTVIPGQTVRLFEVSVLRPEVQPGIIAPTGPVTGVVRELVPGVDFFAQLAGSLSIGVVPLKPLTPQATYMVVVTDGINDTNNLPLVVDFQYSYAKGPNPLSGSLAALEPVRQLVNAMESAAEDAGVNRASIVLSFQFTVQSVGEVVSAAKAFYLDFPASQGAIPPTSFSSLFTDTTPFTGIGAADLYKGQITNNYYLTAPSENNPLAVLNDHWTAAAMVPDGLGGLVANPLAGGNLTYANKLPQVTKLETVPLLVSYPKTSLGCAKPEGGYPVMIFQHGITADRTNLLGIADTMAAPPACTAVIAMDLPLHGITAENPVHLGLQQVSEGQLGIFEGYDQSVVHERTFGVDYIDNATGAPGPDGNPDASGAHSINLQNLQVSRDINKEGTMGLLSLARAIPGMDIDGDGDPDLDATQISFTGHSLGGIVGSSFVAYSDNINSAVFANSGGGIAKMLDASLSFGPRIRAGLAAAGVDINGPDYQTFLFAAQTVIDSSDPVGTSSIAVANNVPTLMFQVANDAVVPNSAPTAPLSGTEPMAEALGLVEVTATTPGEIVEGSRLFTKLNGGLHSTLLTPNDANGEPTLLPYTTEMQGEIASFILSGGTAVRVGDPTLLEQSSAN